MTASRARSRLAIPALLGLFATTASGCGWFFTHGPPAGHQQMTSFSCTQTFTTTVLDLAGFVWFTVNMEVNARNGNVAATAIDGALTVALTWSGLEGAAKVRNCRAAQAQLASRLAVGGTRAVAQAPPAPPVGPVATRPLAAPTAGPLGVRTVTVTPVGDTLGLGQKLQLVATARGANGAPLPGATFVWSSSDAAVVAVSATGVVTARAVGVANVTARADGVIGKVQIVVR